MHRNLHERFRRTIRTGLHALTLNFKQNRSTSGSTFYTHYDKDPEMNKFLIIASVSIVLAAGPIASANENAAAATEQRMEETRERLNLSDEQAEQLAPVMKSSKEARERVLSRYGIDPTSENGTARKLGFKKMRAMRSELQDINGAMLDAVEDILDDEQFDEFKRIQKERQDQMRQRLRGGS